MQMQQQSDQFNKNNQLAQQAQNYTQSYQDRSLAQAQQLAQQKDPYANLLNVGGKLYNASSGQWITPPSSGIASSGW